MMITPARSRNASCIMAPRFWVPGVDVDEDALRAAGRLDRTRAPRRATPPRTSRCAPSGSTTPAAGSVFIASWSGAESVPGLKNRCSTRARRAATAGAPRSSPAGIQPSSLNPLAGSSLREPRQLKRGRRPNGYRARRHGSASRVLARRRPDGIQDPHR